MVSGSPDVSNRFVSPYSNSFVSQSGWWCRALRMSPIHLSPLIAIHLSAIVTGGVWLSGCLQFICLCLKQFICLPVWLVVSGSPDVSNSFVSPYSNSFVSSLASPVGLSACLQFNCLPLQRSICLPVWLVASGSPDVSNSFVSPCSKSFVSQSGWWCRALRMSPIQMFSLIAMHWSPSLAGGVQLSRMSPIQLSPIIAIHFVCHCDWWCLALRMFPIHLSPLTAIHLSPSLAGGVRLPGCHQLICLPLQQFICLPVWLVESGSPDVSNSFVSPFSNSFVCHCDWWCLALRVFPSHLSPLQQFICLPVWLVASGSPDVTNWFVSPYSNSSVSQSGWWHPALQMSPIDLSPLTAIHLSAIVTGGVWLSGCLQFICLSLKQFIFLPVWLVVSGFPDVSNSFVSP